MEREKQEKKVSGESLVLVDELAFIVNTGSNTVITAMDQAETKRIYLQTLMEL